MLAVALVLFFAPTMIWVWRQSGPKQKTSKKTKGGLEVEVVDDGLVMDVGLDGRAVRKLLMIVVLILCLTIVALIVDRIVPRDPVTAATFSQPGQGDAWKEEVSERSIAVMPFVNMSDDTEQEYFSDGLSEELLNLLAKIPDLHVASRTSAFAFKGQNPNLQEAGRTLGVAHILEGSVRRGEGQVRITAQLIDARDDRHLWSETYDRSLDDIFAVQDEIASAVVAQLKLELLGDVPQSEQHDPDAYALFLQARHTFRQGSEASLRATLDLADQALAIDPDYALVWTLKAYTWNSLGISGAVPHTDALKEAHDAIDEAIVSDPADPIVWAAKGYFAGLENDLKASARYYRRALELNPERSSYLGAYANLLIQLNRPQEGWALWEYLLKQDATNTRRHFSTGLARLVVGHNEEAIEAFRMAQVLAPGRLGVAFWEAIALLLLERHEEAAIVAAGEESETWGPLIRSMVANARGDSLAADAELQVMIDQHAADWAFNIAYVYAFANDADRAFEWLDIARENQDAGLADMHSTVMFNPIKNDPRWLPFLESVGLSPDQLGDIALDIDIPLPGLKPAEEAADG